MSTLREALIDIEEELCDWLFELQVDATQKLQKLAADGHEDRLNAIKAQELIDALSGAKALVREAGSRVLEREAVMQGGDI